MDAKMMIMSRAISIRLDNGENLDDILKSYPSLTQEEISELRKEYEK